MNWIRAFKAHSFVQYISMFFLALLVSHQAQALTQGECDNLKPSEMTAKQQRDCSSFSSVQDECASGKRAADSARSTFNKACGDAGIGGSCLSQMQKCSELSGADDYKDSDDLLMAFSSALGVPQSNIGSKCSGMSGQDFFDEKDKTEKKLDDVNDKLADIKKDLANIDKDFNKDVQEVQEEIADAQKELKKKSLDVNKEQRERATEQAKTKADLTKNIRAQESLIMQKRQEINNIYRSKNSSLIAMAESATKRACMKKVKELKKEYEAIAGIGAEHFIERAMKKKKDLQDEWDNCMLQFDQQRIALIEQSDQKVETAQDAINSAQSDIDNMNQQLNSMAAQEAEAKKDDTTSVNNETTALSEKITRATTKLQSLQKTAQAESKALQEKQTYLQKKATTASNALMQMEATDTEMGPSKKRSKVGISEVQSAFTEYADAVNQLPENCAYKGKGEILSAAGISTSSESKKGAK
jgi:uncharacterized protein YukE